ncbi:hypothetical protein AMTRI_Chr02g211540 [Amborella trichopoda]
MSSISYWQQPENISDLIQQIWTTLFSSLGIALWHLVVAASLWNLWKERNIQTFEGQSRDLVSCIDCIKHSSIMWAFAVFLVLPFPKDLLFPQFGEIIFLKKPRTYLNCSWVKVPLGWFKLNFDGSVQGNVCVYGGLLHESSGYTLWSYHSKITFL